MNEAWRTALREARRGAGISMETVAQRSGLSYETVRGYENGRRSPTRESLLKVLVELQITAAEANAIVEQAGFAPEPTLYPPDEFPAYYYRVEELQRIVEKRPWPAFATNDAMRVVAANRAVQAVWAINFAREKRRQSSDQLSLFRIGGDYRFVERVTNWAQIVSAVASINKGRPRRTVQTALAPGVVAAMEATAGGDAAYLKALLKIWQNAKPAPNRVQWDMPLIWRDPEFGEMRFIDTVSVASESDVLQFQDWHPVDGETWSVLDKVIVRAAGQRAKPKSRSR
jgi:transcriptional regulator with XRE-family HTH domain